MKDNKIDFFLVGAARSGTTFIYNYLNNHPNVFLPNVKEPNFFSEVESYIKEDYAAPEKNKVYHSKIINSRKIYDALYLNSKANQIKGDISPSYLWDLNTAQKIYEHNAEAKIMISLRNPIDRAFSHYKMNYYIGMEQHKNFKKALEAEVKPKWGGSNEYLKMSLYYNQIKKYFDVFPASQIKVIIYEEWIENIETTMREITSFLGIENKPVKLQETKIEKNKVGYLRHAKFLNVVRNSPLKKVARQILTQSDIDKIKQTLFVSESKSVSLDPKTREELRAYFAEDIARLSKMLNVDFTEKWF
ncbi:MAG TPA: sulfotransferase [Flavobacteriaceae bacterium]|nr:sulfotransferase [Flavobacteriaceae bacterium]